MSSQISLSQNEMVGCVGAEGLQPKGYEFLTNPKERVDILGNTIDFVNYVEDVGVDTLVFLDKSARPIAWLFKNLWDATQEESRPAIKFVNIGTEKTIGGATPKPDLVIGLRDVFAVPNSDATFLDGKQVVVVDEICSSGKTLTMATKLFNEAFEGRLKQSVSGVDVLAKTPSWYLKASVTGVDDPANRAGLLAVPHPSRRDESKTSAVLLRRDMKLMADSVAAHLAQAQTWYTQS